MLKSAIVLTAVLFSTSALAAKCEKPTAPVLPDPATAVTAQMVLAKNQITDYLIAANAYLECGPGDKKHNRQVKEMKKVGGEFNSAVRSYKERMSSE